jgi:hypothetical protein
VPQVAGFPTEVIVRLPPLVSESTFRPAISSLKLPRAVLGASPEIKLLAAGVQVGVKGKVPIWFVVEMSSVAWAEPAQARKAAPMKITGTLSIAI